MVLQFLVEFWCLHTPVQKIQRNYKRTTLTWDTFKRNINIKLTEVSLIIALMDFCRTWCSELAGSYEKYHHFLSKEKKIFKNYKFFYL